MLLSILLTSCQRPDLSAPKWDIEIYDEGAVSPGYWFVAPYSQIEQDHPDESWNAPLIYDSKGQLVWSGASEFGGFTTLDFRVTNILGRSMLTLIYPHSGGAVIYDDTYQLFQEIDVEQDESEPGNVTLNLHEFTALESGTRGLFLTSAIKESSHETCAAAGLRSGCQVVYDGFDEIDTSSWKRVFRWNSQGRISLDETYALPQENNAEAWDFLHLNSIDKFPDGDYLISGRRTSALYKVSHLDSSIVWRLGGKQSDFQLIDDFEFSGQHMAKLHSVNETHFLVSFLDNAYASWDHRATNEISRGLILSVDILAKTARIVTEYPHPDRMYAKSRGGFQLLPNNHAWICWANRGLSSEHAADGALVMKAGLRAHVGSYRAYKLPWTGRPGKPPDIHSKAVTKDGKSRMVTHVSWNGATEVRRWILYHTDVYGQDRRIAANVTKEGFETEIWTEEYSGHVVAQAIGEHNEALGESPVFEVLLSDQLETLGDELVANYSKDMDPGEGDETHSRWDQSSKAIALASAGLIVIGGVVLARRFIRKSGRGTAILLRCKDYATELRMKQLYVHVALDEAECDA